jgi:serine/threonine-protein kinase
MKTRTGMMMGTPVYMSPEQCRGAGIVDHRSDIYTMGCVMMTMITGAPPFEGSGSGELIVAHMQTPPPLASARVPGLPDIIDAILQRCLAKDPAVRFQSMAELAQALQQAEHAVLGIPPGGYSGGYQAQHTPIGQVRPQTNPYAMQPTPPPAIGMPTPAPIATPTTLSNAAGSQTTPPAGPSKSSRILVIAGATIVAAVVAFVVVSRGSGSNEKRPASEAGSSMGSASSLSAAPADAATIVETPAPADAATVTAAPVDAAMAETPAVVAAPADAGIKPSTKRTTRKKNHGSTPSAAGSVDRGD